VCGLPAVGLALAASSQRHNRRGAILALSTILSGDSLSSPLMPCVRPSSCWTFRVFWCFAGTGMCCCRCS
jgi:hypothetical protein